MGLPLALLAGLPAAGLLIGAGAWVLQRVIGEFIERRGARAREPRAIAALLVGGLMVRVWLTALAIVLAGTQAGREHGLAAALLILVAYTAYLGISLALRPTNRKVLSS